jgi:PLP dependent protein
MSVRENIIALKNAIPKEVLLVAVSKTKPIKDIMLAYDAGQKDFGENKVQELTEKYEKLPKDIKWHMIGHLQTNKVKYIVPFVHLIHGVDSLKLLKEINKKSQQINKTTNCLLQVHIAQEETKFGFSYEELAQVLCSDELFQLKNVNIVGLMGMASLTENISVIAKEFAGLKKEFDKYQKQHPSFEILSMGMSGDYQTAIKQGSTLIRVGSALFGSRNDV